jgi:hypothetical protein
MSKITVAFKKLLGNGRAWRTPSGFTSEFLDILVSPIEEIKERLSVIKNAHFVSVLTDEDNIVNNEELFDITPRNTLAERAEDIDLAWQMLSGNSNYKTLEDYLQRAGFELYIIENVDGTTPNLGQGFNYNGVQYDGEIDDKHAQYGGHTGRVIGNGFLNIEGKIKDPAQFVNGKHAFYIEGFFDPSDNEWNRIIEIVLKLKPAHVVAVCKIASRKVADNKYYNTTVFNDRINGGTPFTTVFREKLNRNRGV